MIALRIESVHNPDERQQPAIVDASGIRPSAAYTIAEGEAPAGVSVVVLRGELDIAAAPALRARIDGESPGGTLVLDLAESTFVDSSVLRELLRARTELPARGVRLVLAAVPPQVRRLLDLTHTSELFEHAPDTATAVTRLSG